ncbi:MAG: nucleoside hydrolase [Armatimonadia bacterium]
MPRRIIFDTDIGTDIDDAYALAFILASPELELVGVTIANNRTDQRAKLALRMLYDTGNSHIPVAVGRQTETGGTVNQAPWAEDFEALQPVSQSAAEFIVEQVNAAPGELTLVPVGPFTNIADALALDPELPGKLREIILMGGCVGWPEGATPEIRAEYNIVTDVPASQAMLSCGTPMTMVPLDATLQVRLEAEDRAKLADCGTPLTEALCGMLSYWGHPTPTLHDPLAVAVTIEPAICGMANLNVVCDDKGFTRVVEGEPNIKVAVTPQVGRFLAMFMERLLGWKRQG